LAFAIALGGAVLLCGYGKWQLRGSSRSTIFLKMRRVARIFLDCPRFYFSKSKLFPMQFVYHCGRSLLVSFVRFFIHKFVRAYCYQPLCLGQKVSSMFIIISNVVKATCPHNGVFPVLGTGFFPFFWKPVT